MNTPWYRKLFSSAQDQDTHQDTAAAEAKAGQGDADCQFALGVKFASSPGEAEDFAEAVSWYRKAADQNHSLAQFNLGMMYAQGQGVAQNDSEALFWIRKAANLGDAGAQFNLGMRSYRASLLRDGPAAEGESKIEAYKWFHLAAGQGYKDSMALWERVTLGMTHEEVAEGNRRRAEVEGESERGE